MSDPVTNVEIEDVLSSIRRLVTEDNRPTETQQAPDDEAAETAEKLVLTPAFRVEDVSEDVTQDEPSEADTADQVAAPVTQETKAEWTESASTQPEDIAEDFGDHRDADWVVEDEPESLPQSNDLETKIAALEAAVGAQADEDWEEETSEDGADELNSASHWEDVEAAFGPKEVSTEPQVAEVDTAEPADVAQFVHTERDAEPAVAPQAAFATTDDVEVEAAALGALDNDADYVDEEALRDLVLEIVREELQGAMGERITRNVRKLVRREIHRILSSQDLG